jgi:hypothetical protein
MVGRSGEDQPLGSRLRLVKPIWIKEYPLCVVIAGTVGNRSEHIPCTALECAGAEAAGHQTGAKMASSLEEALCSNGRRSKPSPIRSPEYDNDADRIDRSSSRSRGESLQPNSAARIASSSDGEPLLTVTLLSFTVPFGPTRSEIVTPPSFCDAEICNPRRRSHVD